MCVMEKKFLIVLTVLAAMLSLTGCDFFRRLAGRPDSEWIEAKAEAIRLEEEARRARQDSLEKALADSAAALAARQKAAAENHRYRYCVVLGAFSSRENAERYAEEVSRKGYRTELIAFRNGSTAVAVSASDDRQEAERTLAEIQRQDFCPKGAWILERK